MSTITGPSAHVASSHPPERPRAGFLAQVNRLVNWFMPSTSDLDERSRVAARMLVYICLINAVFCLLYVVTSHAIGFEIGAVLMASGTVLLFACLFFFRATSRLRVTIHLYMANCTFVAIMGCSFFTGGLYSPVLPWFALVPVMAVLLLGYGRDAMAWFLVCLCIPLAYGAATLSGYTFSRLYRQEYTTVFGIVCILGLVAVVLVIALTFDYNSRRAMQQVVDGRKELERLAREQERMAERGRILRDMHDGVGSHISSAMRQLGGPLMDTTTANTNEVMQTLRAAMDNLKLSIDSLHLLPGDVTALLANMRYRLGPRFAGLGVDLQWDVEWLPACAGLDASAMSDLRFMVLEALSNTLQHSHASVVRVEGHARPDTSDHVVVRVSDNGCGFDTQLPLRNGLATMRSRGRAIGAELHITSALGKTVVEIRLPVSVAPAPGAAPTTVPA